MMYFMGIDIGTGTSKGVLLRDFTPVADHALPSGIHYKSAADELAARLLEKRRIPSASSTSFPRIKSITSRAFWGDPLMYFAVAFASMALKISI